MCPLIVFFGPGGYQYRFRRFWGVSVLGCICVSLDLF